ncbi:glucosaminidase domain-containing protein, partial [uncultured Clostridium sp.]|uniref:glucosaminidase domain-containing protein n=1 Tax=uncultured Clostridium sp. TaxID=59620 RepID=UPI002637EC36
MRRYFSENIISRVLVICFITSFFSGVNVYAIEEKNNNIQDINIVSRTTITKEEAKEWARKNNATDTFINLADLYWKYYNQHGGVNPLVAYIQSAKETAYGRFGGVIDESYYNPCGMKKADAGTEDDDYDPNAHHRFNNWEEGVKAHLDHLALYAGAKTYPREETYDPRHSKWILGQATTVNSLGGKWAPSTSYGREIMKTYKYVLRLFDVGESLINANLNIANGKLNISGWALNKSGVREIRYYIDGAYQGKATVGISTPELVDEYPGYPNVSKSGFNISLDLSKLKPGKRKIEIGQIGNDGTKKSEAYYYEVPSMENRIDAKVSATNNKLNVNGWALNKSGVKEVRYYIDGTYQGKTTVGLSTPELVNKYPSYPNAAKSGFNISLDLSKLKPGKRKIEIGQIGNDGTK